MDTRTRPPLHPALMVAAASVTAFSLAGIGVLTGVLPFGRTADAPTNTTLATTAQIPAAPSTSVATTSPAAAPAGAAATSPARKPAATRNNAAAKKAAREGKSTRAQDLAEIDVDRYDRPPAYTKTAVPVAEAQPAPICTDCGVVESVREVSREPDGSGVGAVAGGILGGVLGNQIGNGHGRELATVVGLIGGAVAGNHIEKAQKRSASYEVTVRFDDGTSRVFTQQTAPGWRSGDRVKVENGLIVSRA